MVDDERKAREQEFHDRTFGDHKPRGNTGVFYTITDESYGRHRELIFDGCAGKRVLEYGCGPGSHAFEMARRGAHVTGIDISPVAMEIAREQARTEGLDVEFAVMDAENTSFPNGTFDLIVGSGILHHLDLARTYAELARLLAPGGRAVFVEPLGHNALINLYRKVTPGQRTPDEHPLLRSDLADARRRFGDVRVRYYHLAALAAAPFAKTPLFKPLLAALSALDRALLSVPAIQPYAWIAVMELGAPR
ncbi:MAG: type 11 methyltransferase [Candidatus Eremiobacteraeota bacterium]|nr:type 11 methyltransferase [Candidatus Eremiobacteraeota bacterium]